MVGVANDAVNFLNSAIGSNAANFKTIILVAALGVLTGVLMSSGMMEIARKGIFNPQQFVMPELMIIFVAVMFQDIILLDTFNTFGLPTSTTVSIVFGLFGSALAMSLIKIFDSGAPLIDIVNYINTEKVAAIIGAIVFSIILAFIIGSAVQFITRLIFSFNYKKRFNRYGSIWGAVALTALTFFLLLKGAKGATFIDASTKAYINTHVPLISLYVFGVWTLILLISSKIFKLNILKFIVMFGTFSLALAFAANDLVNFIGAPLAGLNAYQLAMATDDPLNTPMGVLASEIQAESWMLLVAGGVMIITLYFNKKAYTVARTTISLGRQEEGYERFKSNMLSRWLVRGVINIGKGVNNIMGSSYDEFMKKRLNPSEAILEDYDDEEDAPAFDLIRAAVILMVAAALISFATSLKLPLSTTYVTFIVAMAAALPDKAWGRESAVFRVAGVITVVAGWFVTAIGASIIAGIIATILYFGEIYALAAFILIVAFIIYRTTRLHKDRELEYSVKELGKKITKSKQLHVLDTALDGTTYLINNLNNLISMSVTGLLEDNVKLSRKALKEITELEFSSDKINVDMLRVVDYDKTGELDFADDFADTISGVKDINDSAKEISERIHNYVDNNHDPLLLEQRKELFNLDTKLSEYIDIATSTFRNKNFETRDQMLTSKDELDELISLLNKNQLERIKDNKSRMRRSMLFLNILKEIQTMTTRCFDTINAFAHLYKKKQFIITEDAEVSDVD